MITIEETQTKDRLVKVVISSYKRWRQRTVRTGPPKASSKSIIDALCRQPVVMQVTVRGSLSRFDAALRDITPQQLRDAIQDNTDPVFLFIDFKQFLYTVRKTILRKFNVTRHSFRPVRQQRLVNPGREAFAYMGNNKLDIKQSKNAYGIVFDR